MPASVMPTRCPRCDSSNWVYLEAVETSTCLECDLDWWWSEDDGKVVTTK